MPKLIKFHTRLITSDYHRYPPPPIPGKQWHVTFDELPEGFYPRGGEISVDSKGKSREYIGKEVIIHASSSLRAQRVANLIHSAILLLDGSGFMHGTEPRIFPVKRPQSKVEEEQFHDRLRKGLLQKPDIPLACIIAAKASFRHQYAYALAKLKLSYELYSTLFVNLNPYYSPNMPKSPYPEDQVRFAYSIVLAYAVIEEIGLEIRASSKNPSTIKGQWNPVVKNELEKRLRQANVKLTENFLWTVRGARTSLEKARPPRKASKPTWARQFVRDTYVEVVDAIAHVSWLRSKVAAHRMNEAFVKVLSPYDVANAQFLARRLLLSKLGFWRYHERNSVTKD